MVWVANLFQHRLCDFQTLLLHSTVFKGGFFFQLLGYDSPQGTITQITESREKGKFMLKLLNFEM